MREPPTGKLIVILHADVVGSTALVQRDERRAHERITDAFQRFASTIQGYYGQVLEIRGDALVAEFARASDAVCASLRFQHENAEHNEALSDDLVTKVRIGIGLGEVVIADDTVTGAGVVLAQRLEQLAEPDGVCLQGAAYETVPRRLPFEYRSLGEQKLKGFEEPVRAYTVSVISGESPPEPEQAAAALSVSTRRISRRYIAGGIVALAIVAGTTAWLTPWQVTEEETVSIEKMAFPLPDKPSIAVLPFTNMSKNPEQEYFADGMTEDLITDLSKISGLFVIARNSSFYYKGKQVIVKQVAQELGVRFVLQGSVRRSGNRVRINTQLIDATTGGHAWAERYEGVMTDVFALQDEVTNKIITALAIKLTGTERRNLALMPTENLEAYDSFLRAERGLYSQNSEDLAAALSYFRRATEIDPTFARAWAGHARAAVDIWRFDWFDIMPGHLARRKAYEAASRALSLDPSNAQAFSVLAILQMVESHYDEALDSARKAVTLSPNDADAQLNLALIRSYAGEHDEAVETMEVALRLNPKPPSGFYRLAGFIQLMANNYDKAVSLLTKARNASPSDPSHQELAMAYAQKGQFNQARVEVDGMLKLWPAANLAYYRVLYSHHKREDDLNFRIDALRKAGLPEWPYGYRGHEEYRLSGSEIEQLLFDRFWYGSRVGAEEFIRDNTEAGLVRFRDPKAHPGRSRSAYMLEGTATINGDMLCYQYEEFLLGRKYCGYLYRNPGGSEKEKNVYVDVNAIVIDYFTVGSERHAN